MVFAGLVACTGAPQAHAEVPGQAKSQPEELGHVQWRRGFDDAVAAAERANKPLLVLFTEVPGCSTVKNYGNTTLSDPLVVEAAESLFVPVVVYNNVGGPDRAVLQSFKEPAWNNPVVRILDANRQGLVPRLTGDWSRGALLSRMVSALEAAKQPVPEWLKLVAWEDRTQRNTATYAMGCFWSGEAHLGRHEAVVATRTGFQGGREVVQLEWDPARVDRTTLDQFAAAGHARPAAEGAFRPSASDDLHAIRRTKWGKISMTAAQATRVNADVAAGRDPSRWLSPRQRGALP